jgi:hypothetical protein
MSKTQARGLLWALWGSLLGAYPYNPDRYVSVGLNLDYIQTEGTYNTFHFPGPTIVPNYMGYLSTAVVGDLRIPVSNRETVYFRAGTYSFQSDPSPASQKGFTVGVGARHYFIP